ncbi:sigma-70 family RNA polymerase sigma factor [Actinoplanes sp. TRM 88003]|uniref:Sigma-70 family RNA polymerase sigma factor n=1 Tax=Paractinoplanes aksuensis TaxID=2939490 RepID=A0ABT1DSX0_9ACTN|nr:sigma-70 family RNA polymerase sigma factor [Actinoplanes aksuensis]MCO8272816.1 sigma-70 family RNA polymerase sigma factor [Actinoplanes aksuensis]
MTQSQIAPDLVRLVRTAQSGDAAARDALIAQHLPLIYNIIGRALDGHPDVDDVVQETMLRAVRGLDGLREPVRFRSWLVTIAYRQIQLHLRARRTNRDRTVPAPLDVPDPDGDFAERATAEIVVADQRRELIEATHWLDDQDRRLLGLWWQEAAGELTRTELAAALEVPPKHAAVRVQRMKAQLDAARGVVRALRSRPRCPELMAQVRRWNGVADPLWRKRLGRHVRECQQCTLGRHGLVAPEELLLGIAALPVPAALAALATGAATKLAPALSHKLLAVAAVASVAVGGGIVYAVNYSPAPARPPVAVAPPAVVRPSAPGAVAQSRAAVPASASPTARPVVVGTGVQRADIYVAPGGSDQGDGSLGKPYATLDKAAEVVRPGQTIALRGGVYDVSSEISISVNGTSARRITVSNYRDERPILDAAGLPDTDWAIEQSTAYWTVQGLEIRNAPSHALVCSGCRNNVFQRLTLRSNTRAGMMLRDPGTTGNQVLNSDFSGSEGIGLGVQFGSGTGNVVRGNRFFGNRLAGLDLKFDSAVLVEGNWSYDNGGSGFVLTGEPASHQLRDNAAWDNGSHGFTDDAGPTEGLALTDNTAFRNRGSGFALPGGAATLRSNVAVGNTGEPAGLAPDSPQAGNSWQQSGWTADRFRSTTPPPGPRGPDGRLPRTDFLVTDSGPGATMTAD